MLIIILAVLVLTGICYGILCNLAIKEERRKTERLIDKLQCLGSELSSVRVRHGMAWEQWIPLASNMENELGPKENVIFLGRPIDLIYFNENEIIFVEVKTGNSKVNQRQQRIKYLIKNGKVRWAEIRDGKIEEKQKEIKDDEQNI